MRAVLINSVEQTITEVDVHLDYSTHGFSSVNETIDCEIFERVPFDGIDHHVYIDESGILPHRYKGVRFMTNNYPSPLAGNGLVLGTKTGPDGEDWAECTLSLKEVASNVAFFIKDVQPNAY